MVIKIDKGEIANWWFEMNSYLDTSLNEKIALKPLLNNLNNTLKILTKRKMLFPTEIVLEDWVKFDYKKQVIHRKKKELLSIDITKYQDLNIETCILDILDKEFEDSDYLYPLEIKILGNGIVFDEFGNEQLFSNVLWIHGISFGNFVINICSQSYAWLEYNSKGLPQTEICKKNKKRLEETLNEISELLEVLPEDNSMTDFAITKGFSAINLFDIDGEPLKF